MRKYLGIVSILIIVVTFLVLYLTREYIGQSYVALLVVGYLAAMAASWFSLSGIWRKISASVLVILPLGFLVLVILLSYAWSQ